MKQLPNSVLFGVLGVILGVIIGVVISGSRNMDSGAPTSVVEGDLNSLDANPGILDKLSSRIDRTLNGEAPAPRPERRISREESNAMINAMFTRAKSRPPGALHETVSEVIEDLEDVPTGLRTVAWSTFFKEAIMTASADEIIALLLDSEETIYLPSKEQTLLTGGTVWSDLARASILRCLDTGGADKLSRETVHRFERGNQQQRDLAALVQARLCKVSDVLAFDRTTEGLPYDFRVATQDKLIDLWAKFSRGTGLDFLTRSEPTLPATPEQVARIMDESWFLENARILSEKVAAAVPSHNRDLVIARMVELIAPDDPQAAALWLGEIANAELRDAAAAKVHGGAR